MLNQALKCAKLGGRRSLKETKEATMKTSRLILAGIVIAAFCFHTGFSFSADETGKKAPTQDKAVALKISIEGEGTSIEKPIVIIGAPDHMTGVALEYGILRGLYPNAKVMKQQLLRQGGRSYDLMVLKSEEGRELRIFFDITDFLGKLPR